MRLPLLLALAQLPLSYTVSTSADDGTADWRKALRLFKQKQFEKACPLFESVAKAKQTDAAVWADLGLCELKRSEQTASVHASGLAVRFGSEKVRLAAYFNLYLAEHAVALPNMACGVVPSSPELGCSEAVAVCVAFWQNFGTGQSTQGAAAYFADTIAHAEALAAEVGTGISAYRDDIHQGLALSEDQVCHFWCGGHPEVHCVDTCQEGPLLSCSVVSVDACQKRVGYVCRSTTDGKLEHPIAGEFDFPERSE